MTEAADADARREAWRLKKQRQRAGRSMSPQAKSERRDRAQKRATVATVPAETKAPQRISADMMQRIIEASREMAKSRGGEPVNPFKLPFFPPEATPKKGAGIAMDECLPSWSSGAWAAGAALNGAFSEGLLFLGYPYLAELAQRPEYRVFSETIADDATRKWIDFEVTGDEEENRREKEKDPVGFQERMDDPDERKKRVKAAGKDDKVKALKDDQDRLEVRDRFYAVSRNDGFFGRSHLFMNFGRDLEAADKELQTDIGDGRNAVSKAKVKQGSFRALRVIEPVWVYPTNYNAQNPLRDDWYNPQQWFVLGSQIHASRIPVFVGHTVPDLLKPAYAFGGISLSQLAKPYVDIWLTTRESVGQLIHAFSVMVLSTDLSTIMQPGGANDLLTRLAMFNELRDNQGVFAINKATEDFKNVSASIAGLHELQAQSQEHMMSVARIPAVKFTGIQPTGLNASSEGEMMAYDDTIGAYQNRFMRPTLTKVVNFQQLSLWGEVDPELTYVFQKLREATPKEQAELQKARAERDKIFVDGGAISPEEWRGAIIADPELPFAGLDPEDVPDLAEEEEEGLQPDGGRPNPSAAGEPDNKGGGAEDEAILPFVGDAWSEGDHPRGQPGNAGQFGPGGGGSGKLQAPQFGMVGGKFTAGGGASSSAPAAGRRGNIGKPLDPSTLTKVGKQMGSNPGGVFEGAEGKRFYVKQGKSKDHVRNEMIAAALYDLAGTPTLKYRPTVDGGHVATEIAKLDKDNASKLSPDERAEAQRDFAVHAWLGNWDAVGLGGDNLGTVRGVPTALDLGGALEYRAQGSPKGKAFGSTVGELDTLRSKSRNSDAAGIFGDMTPAAMRESARFVTDIPDARIKSAVEKQGGAPALADKLIARKNDIAEKAKTFGAEGDPKSKGGTMVIPAGGKMPVAELNGVKFEAWSPPEDWASVDGQMLMDETELVIPKGKQAASGVIITEPDGRIWMVQPKGGFGGYEGTFPKGRAETGLSLQANAIKEAFEESGLKVRITGHAGDAEGDATMTRYYTATREGGDPSKHDDETAGVVLAPKSKASGFLNRKRDRQVIGQDEAWQESKHPRGKGGKFAETAGGGGATPPDDDPDHGEEPEKEEGETYPGFENSGATKPKKTAFGGLWKVGVGAPGSKEEFGFNLNHVLGKTTNAGSTYRTMLGHFLKNAAKNGYGDKVDAIKAKLGEAYDLASKKALAAMEATSDPAEKAKFAAIAGQAKNKMYGLGIKPSPAAPAVAAKPATKPDVSKIAEQAMKDNPGMAAALKSVPTPAELDKAKKSIALQPQYVPGFGDLQFTPTKTQAQGLVGEFNAKWQGKDGLLPVQLSEKVKDFKVLAAKVATLKAAEAVNAQQLKAKEQEAQKAAAAKQAEAAAAAEKKKAAAELQKSKAVLKSLMDELGVDSEADAAAVQGLMELAGVSTPGGVIEKFTSTNNPLAAHGVTNFEFSLLKSYTGSAYAAVNKALRAGTWTTKQHMYVNAVNKALKKMPSYAGVSKRGTTLPLVEQQKLAAGHVIVEHAFMSTSKTSPWSGNTHYVIQGKSGRDVQKISNYHSEAEVLYPARTFFQVTKVDGKPGGQMTVHLSEVEAW